MKFSFLGLFSSNAEEPTLELYGKLLIAKDYLRVGCGSDAGRGLREWLDRGFAGELGANVPPYPMRFLWTDRAGAPLQGTLRSSSDAGGLRPFPIVLFVERRARALAAELARAPAGDEGWWRALDDLHAELAGFGEGSALLSALRGRKVRRGETASDGPSELSLATWAEALFPGDGAAGYERLSRELERFVREDARASDGRIVRLPLAWGSPMGPQVGTWLRRLAELGWGGGARPPTLFYPASSLSPASNQAIESAAPAPAFLLVHSAFPEPEQASWLHPARKPERGDLCSAEPAPVLPAGTPESSRSPS